MKYVPSLMDVLFAGMMFIPWIPGDMNRGLFFVFYSAFLFILSLSMTPRRQFKSPSLSMFVMWSLAGLFIHSFAIYPKTVIDHYRNFNIMAEGFLYILFGAIFIRTVVMYSKSLKFTYLLIPLALLPWLNGAIYHGKSTQIVALGISMVIYMFLSKRYRWGLVAVILGAGGVVAKWSWLCMKFRCRPYVWLQMLINSFYHPIRRDSINVLDVGIELSPGFEKFLISYIPNFSNVKPWLAGVFGSGFTSYLNKDYLWVDYKSFGWVHRQNDYFHLMECSGIIGLGLLVWFIVDCLKAIGVRPALMLFMTILLVCFAQLTMFDIGTGGVCLAIMTFILAEGIADKRRILV